MYIRICMVMYVTTDFKKACITAKYINMGFGVNQTVTKVIDTNRPMKSFPGGIKCMSLLPNPVFPNPIIEDHKTVHIFAPT